ncbi:RsmB/NOP family class I SAM-dependent RNA methyltransferase [Rubellicoccus peritrichatus]|uniref:RsmB/NOP family class I SAM-dependent RNA methyltransferase n=1 Tax=Rubellicoccus peritrichatus TaxID=3080537 RepID=A0AAQ3LF37_9BACT|nr:RsmB/NOP family class I SAM-dependent RNA methyltransferase [Puniceicoccus sp. CR14]WOO40759.1 RsmB/NOP family class I SAM-dependent RNA methyltransferase [Puniceicoccus sp. CR14]
MSKNQNNLTAGWELAARLCGEYPKALGKAEALLDRYVNKISIAERKRCQFLFLGAIRHWLLIDHTINSLVTRQPKPRLRGMLTAALADLLQTNEEKVPQVVDFWVGKTREKLSRGEGGLVNAVLRRARDVWSEIEQSGNRALLNSHPGWLVEKWLSNYGLQNTELLLNWDQQPAEVFLRIRDASLIEIPGCSKTEWPGFIRYESKGIWQDVQKLLNEGKVYVQDPSTRIPPSLLEVQPGQRVLDLCSAPGGKALILAEALKDDEAGELVCVDLPGPRITQLDENLRKLSSDSGPTIQLLQANALEIDSEEMGPFDAVLLDAPCTNTGVLRRRPDAKLRLEPKSVTEMSDLQFRLLTNASSFVRAGGKLVHSTCSIEPEENEQLVERFLAANSDFELLRSVVSLPWECHHDGGGAFLMKRKMY